MHILLICALDVWSLDQGKGAPTLERTLRAYGDAGHTVDAVLPDIGANHFYDPSRPAPTPESRPAIPNVRFHTFHMPSLRDFGARVPQLRSMPDALTAIDQKVRFAAVFPWLAAKRAEHLLQTAPTPFDVVYAYEAHAVLAARLLRRRGARLPLIARFQGTVMHPALTDRLLYLRRYEEALALKTRADMYIMTDDGTRGDDVLARLNPASRGRVKFWRNGLDLDHLHAATRDDRARARAALGITPDAFVMLTASRLASWKRIDRAIRALPRVRTWVPGAQLLVVGDGEERPRLHALARSLGVEHGVRFAGAVPQGDVMGYMHASDLFLAVADLSNVGNPLLEAMTCGMCIVAVNAGDTRDLIADGVTGRLVDSSQRSGVVKSLEERLAELIVTLSSDAEQRERLAASATAYAREHFWSWDARMAAEVEAVGALVAHRSLANA